MSGHMNSIVGQKKFVRYMIFAETADEKKVARQFKKKESALDHAETLLLKGFQKVEMFENTKIFKTEKIL
jgi:hypothetical protein